MRQISGFAGDVVSQPAMKLLLSGWHQKELRIAGDEWLIGDRQKGTQMTQLFANKAYQELLNLQCKIYM